MNKEELLLGYDVEILIDGKVFPVNKVSMSEDDKMNFLVKTNPNLSNTNIVKSGKAELYISDQKNVLCLQLEINNVNDDAKMINIQVNIPPYRVNRFSRGFTRHNTNIPAVYKFVQVQSAGGETIIKDLTEPKDGEIINLSISGAALKVGNEKMKYTGVSDYIHLSFMIDDFPVDVITQNVNIRSSWGYKILGLFFINKTIRQHYEIENYLYRCNMNASRLSLVEDVYGFFKMFNIK